MMLEEISNIPDLRIFTVGPFSARIRINERFFPRCLQLGAFLRLSGAYLGWGQRPQYRRRRQPKQH